MPISRLRATPPQSKTAAIVSPCLPTLAVVPPVGSEWIHEIKLDGYRLMVRRHRDRVKLLTRNGADWTQRYPLIVRSALALPAESFLIDGEATWCDRNGVPDFATLHSRSRDQ